ncbi:helix-turn-helix domain-containing protein [Alkalimonas sp. NCh-2]|uniref:helix-turn-helix transcriptional regulator n=1 Tax=Alkalimonas sp. NCh-2 TaxID=3144846 RepID=UPI0031F688D5
MAVKNNNYASSDNNPSEKSRSATEVMMQSNLNNKAVLNVAECSAFTGLSVSYIYKLTHTGKIPHSKPNGKLVFFDPKKVEEWLLSNPIETEADSNNFIATQVRAQKLRP